MNSKIDRKTQFSKFRLYHSRELNVFFVMMVIWIIFIIANPMVFFKPFIYLAVFQIAPTTILISLAMVFVIAAGEIDLSFGSTAGVAALAFAWFTKAFANPYLGLFVALIIGVLVGFINGILVTKLKLSSLVSTLGMLFFLRGIVMVITQGNPIGMTSPGPGDFFYDLFFSKINNFPAQMIWATAFLVFFWFLFHRFRYGAHVHFVGDNRESAREMGVNVDRTIIVSFILVGICSAIAGMFSVEINRNYWSTVGEGYLLFVLAAVFVGGTPTWGGIGTILGAYMGSLIISFLETGIIAAGLTGFWTRLIYGLIIILSIINHRFGAQRKNK